MKCTPPEDFDWEWIECRNNFDCDVFVPRWDSVWVELYSGDTLLEVDTNPSPQYSRLPSAELEFREHLTLRIHVLCNGIWLDERDYEFENRMDKYTRIWMGNEKPWNSGTSGVQIFDDEQLAKCPELSEYLIYETKDDPPDCFVPSVEDSLMSDK